MANTTSDDAPMHELREKMLSAEMIGEDIVSSRLQMVDFDRKRNSNREALRQIASCKKPSKQLWLCHSNIFIQLPTNTVKSIIEKEQKHLDAEIRKLQDDLKVKTSQLAEVEGLPDPIVPYNLHPFSLEDLNIHAMK